MPIDSVHPAYFKYAGKWERLRDTFEGSDEVKNKGEKYLPKLKAQNDDDYHSYKTRALYFDGLEKTIKGLTGAVMRIEPLIEAPKPVKALFSDITKTGMSLNSLITLMIKEQLLLGRQGILVDYDGVPYLIHYSTEQITNWFDGTIVLKEAYKVKSSDKYKLEYETQYRELTLIDGVYTVIIWREDEEKKGIWVAGKPIIAERKGSPLDYIPFVGESADGLNLNPSKSAMLPLADVSLSLYRTSADLEHGRHFTALPTPYATNITPDQTKNAKFNIGPSKVWLLPEGAKAGYLEFTGQGLKALETGMSEKLSMMAILGSQLLQAPKAGIEAAETVRLKQNAEASTLLNAVKMVEQSITQALTYMSEWLGLTGEISVKLNTDFISSKISSQDLLALMNAWQAGAISQDTFLLNLKKGEILDSEVSIEKDKIDLESGELDGND